MQFAGDLAQRRFTRVDELLRQFAPLVGEGRQLMEQALVRPDEEHTGGGDGGQRGDQEPAHLPLHRSVDLLHLLRRLGLALVVLHEEAGHGGADGRLPRLQRQPHLAPRLDLVAVRGQLEQARRRVPELRDGRGEVTRLLGRPARDRHRRLLRQRLVEIGADPVELRRPGGQGVGLVGVEHVAHGERQLVQVALDAQQLQRVATVAIGELGLQLAQPADLARDIDRVGQHDGQRHDETE